MPARFSEPAGSLMLARVLLVYRVRMQAPTRAKPLVLRPLLWPGHLRIGGRADHRVSNVNRMRGEVYHGDGEWSRRASLRSEA